MAQGTIKSIRDDRGFGFIRPDGATQDIFFHSSAVEDRQFDQLRQDLDAGADMMRMDNHAATALDIVTSSRVREAFEVDREPERLRDLYGRCSVGEKALLARRLVEAGTTFVLVSGRWGYFDHHGDNVPPWGGIQRGLTPILPTIDRALATLVEDLEDRGLLDSTLVLMLGEFGRGPVLTKDGGREHWLPVMSMLSSSYPPAHRVSTSGAGVSPSCTR